MKNKELLSIGVYIAVGVIFAVSIQSIFGLALGTDLPIVAVQSGSMEPTFYKGDLLLLTGVDKEKPDIKLGDIIVFTHALSETPVVHRVVAINSDGTYQTKGDANAGQHPFEKRITIAQVKGKSILIVPYLGWIKIIAVEMLLPFIRQNIIFIAAIAIGVYFIAMRRK